MAYELLYTSVPKGLKPGTKGFCTVACTNAMPSAHVQIAETLSAYKNIYQPHEPDYDKNPVVYAHQSFISGGMLLHTLSRVAALGSDYSGRNNKLAHCILLSESELTEGGPASLMQSTGFFQQSWEEEPHIIKATRRIEPNDVSSFKASHWQAVAGDAGWAGDLAQQFLNAPESVTYLVFSPGTDTLPLMAEALALIPPAKRWQVTFNTYFISEVRGSACNWRCVLPDSPLLATARRAGARIIDLTQPLGECPSGGSLINAARNGNNPDWAAFAPPPSKQVTGASEPEKGGAPSHRLVNLPTNASVRLPPANPGGPQFHRAPSASRNAGEPQPTQIPSLAWVGFAAVLIGAVLLASWSLLSSDGGSPQFEELSQTDTNQVFGTGTETNKSADGITPRPDQFTQDAPNDQDTEATNTQSEIPIDIANKIATLESDSGKLDKDTTDLVGNTLDQNSRPNDQIKRIDDLLAQALKIQAQHKVIFDNYKTTEQYLNHKAEKSIGDKKAIIVQIKRKLDDIESQIVPFLKKLTAERDTLQGQLTNHTIVHTIVRRMQANQEIQNLNPSNCDLVAYNVVNGNLTPLYGKPITREISVGSGLERQQ